MICLSAQDGGNCLLRLYVQPRASRNALVGLHGDALKICLTSPPVDGKANKAALAFLAKSLQLPKAALVLASGHQSRNKTILIVGIDYQRLAEKLLQIGVGP